MPGWISLNSEVFIGVFWVCGFAPSTDEQIPLPGLAERFNATADAENASVRFCAFGKGKS
jgi:hypothetical protein